MINVIYCIIKFEKFREQWFLDESTSRLPYYTEPDNNPYNLTPNHSDVEKNHSGKSCR